MFISFCMGEIAMLTRTRSVACPDVRQTCMEPRPSRSQLPKSLGTVSPFNSAPARPNSSIAGQVQIIITVGNSSSATSNRVPASSSSHLAPTNSTTTVTDSSFGFADPPPYNKVAGSIRPDADRPFVLSGAWARGSGALENLGEGAGRLDEHPNEQNPLEGGSIRPSSTSCLTSHRTRFSLQTQNDFISISRLKAAHLLHTNARHHHHHHRAYLHYLRKRKLRLGARATDHLFFVRDDFETLNFPPDQQQQFTRVLE
ncbi:hypothetical protein FRC00_009152, partial [Tulasnella sp. 408]